MSERCDYCGRFTALVDYGAEWGTEWVCSQQRRHAVADPEHWTVPDLDAFGCRWLGPEPGHEDEGYTCTTHNMPWGECVEPSDQSHVMRCPGCDCEPVGWAPHNGQGDCPPKPLPTDPSPEHTQRSADR